MCTFKYIILLIFSNYPPTLLIFSSVAGDSSKAIPTLAPGDIVEVREGQLMHLQGKVINVEGDVITIMPKHEDLKV